MLGSKHVLGRLKNLLVNLGKLPFHLCQHLLMSLAGLPGALASLLERVAARVVQICDALEAALEARQENFSAVLCPVLKECHRPFALSEALLQVEIFIGVFNGP
mmetsp:Transcript_17950/g.24103  ORF Transcript_17950/g.24103 Transcript_17950/m.24103 type:complete len:104 (-) Transcript_17950:363-674(-)